VKIWRIDTAAPGAPASSPPVVAIASTRRDAIPHFAPDGHNVAFTSTRSGGLEIWRADVSGGSAVQLTSMDLIPGWPRWSPDGKLIAFHSNPDGNGDIMVVPSEGGKPRNLTAHPANDTFPTFSHDGRWIYFGSSRAGLATIWKIPVSGGPAVQVTTTPSLMAIESPDGVYLYYIEGSSTNGTGPLWRMPAAGGAAVKIAEGVNATSFDVVAGGIYYLERVAGETRLQYFDLAMHKTTTVARNLGDADFGLCASPDGRTILFSRVDSTVNDLMLVEGFR
jgi:Tol biopolymer transport system component